MSYMVVDKNFVSDANYHYMMTPLFTVIESRYLKNLYLI